MYSDRVFQIALLISVITHGVILVQNSHLKLFATKKIEQKLEVSYIKNLQELKIEPIIAPPKKESFMKSSSKIMAQKSIPPPFIDKENIFRNSKEILSQKYTFNKPSFIKPDIIAIRKKITLPPIGLDKINNPTYISYYQIVREKIRRAAYQNYNRAEVGEEYLSFAILSDGSLKEVQLVQEKSSPSAYLREIALRSIKEASAFPNFPKELDYPQLSFNVVISFEIE
jgi:TonB family protein